MPKGENSGGRIPPDNRPMQAPGVGKRSRRHDLERRSVPFLHGSDLQQGDVQAMEQGQRVLPAKTQQPGKPFRAGKDVQTTGKASSATLSAPDPIEFLGQRAGGTLRSAPAQIPQRAVDVSGWTRIVEKIANAPGASGVLRQAFLHQFSALARRPYVPDVFMVDLQALDAGVEADLNGR